MQGLSGRERVVEERRKVVVRGLLAHRTEGEVAKELSALPVEKRPADCSPAAVGKEMAAVHEEWARERAETLERLLDEDLARFAEIEAKLLPECLKGTGDAIDRWLRLQAARAQRVGQRNGAGMVEAGVVVGGESGGARAIEVRVRYVDDWRAVRNGAMGVVDGT